VLGSIFTSLYASHLATSSFSSLPASVVSASQNSVAAGLATVHHASGHRAQQHLLDGLQASFMSGFHIACVVAAAVCVAGAAGALLLPGRPQRAAAEPAVPEPAVVGA
jgi:hypothetical protein